MKFLSNFISLYAVPTQISVDHDKTIFLTMVNCFNMITLPMTNIRGIQGSILIEYEKKLWIHIKIHQ